MYRSVWIGRWWSWMHKICVRSHIGWSDIAHVQGSIDIYQFVANAWYPVIGRRSSISGSIWWTLPQGIELWSLRAEYVRMHSRLENRYLRTTGGMRWGNFARNSETRRKVLRSRTFRRDRFEQIKVVGTCFVFACRTLASLYAVSWGMLVVGRWVKVMNLCYDSHKTSDRWIGSRMPNK